MLRQHSCFHSPHSHAYSPSHLFLFLRFHDEFHSIFPMGDISALIPDEEADVCVLEEPEHLNWLVRAREKSVLMPFSLPIFCFLLILILFFLFIAQILIGHFCVYVFLSLIPFYSSMLFFCIFYCLNSMSCSLVF